MNTPTTALTSNAVAALLCRVLLAQVFLIAGFLKVANFEQTASFMASKGLPLIELLLVASIAIEIGASLAILAGWRTRWAALLLILWLIPVTLVFHRFWDLLPVLAPAQQTQFTKNLAIMGGLLALWLCGPGPLSLDARREISASRVRPVEPGEAGAGVL